jgi:hypothetical protein
MPQHEIQLPGLAGNKDLCTLEFMKLVSWINHVAASMFHATIPFLYHSHSLKVMNFSDSCEQSQLNSAINVVGIGLHHVSLDIFTLVKEKNQPNRCS